MAAAIGESSNDRQECPICLDVFISPRQLPCLHSFCEHCLQDYVTNKASCTAGVFEEFMCPVCRAATRPAKKDKPVGEWASLFHQSPISLVSESKAKVEPTCNICPLTSKTATKFCAVCEEFMCDDCFIYHQKMKLSRNHQMVTVEEVMNDPKNRLKFAEGLGCPAHDHKEVEFYCKSHEAACCGTCSFLHHKTCKEVLELKTNLTDLLKEMNPQKINEGMSQLQDHLKTFIEINESKICILESDVKNIASEIVEIRKKINAMLDDIEKTVKSEGHKIYKEEMIKKQEQNHQCQSLINAIRNSHALLQMVSQYGTDTQTFLVTSKTVKQLQSYSDQIREEFERVDCTKISLELNSNMTAILSQDAREMVKIACKEEAEDLHCTSIIRPLRVRTVELSKIIDVQYHGGKDPTYHGIVQLPGGDTLLADYNSKTCSLYDSFFNFVTSYTLMDKPYDVCLVDDCELAVTMPFQNTIQFLTIKDRSIIETGTIKTAFVCYGVDAVSKEEIVVAGLCNSMFSSSRCYWSLTTREGKKKFHHEFDCLSTGQVYIALDSSKSRVYISVGGSHSVYCFGLSDGRKYFVYTSNNLKYPLGIAVDREDNVYVVGYTSKNIHKMSPEGIAIQVITSGVPENPNRISFSRNKDQFIITNQGPNRRTLLFFVHK